MYVASHEMKFIKISYFLNRFDFFEEKNTYIFSYIFFRIKATFVFIYSI